jgi:hypothetical protein
MGVFLYPPRDSTSLVANGGSIRAETPRPASASGTAGRNSNDHFTSPGEELSSGSKPDMHAVPWITVVNHAPKRAASRHAGLIKLGEWV